MIYAPGTAPTDRLDAHPRAVYRITLERSGVGLPFIEVVTFDAAVSDTVDAIARSGYGIPLGYVRPGVQDQVAIIEVRAPTAPAPSVTVGDLARTADGGSYWTRVQRIVRDGPVPGFSDEEGQRKRAAELAAETTRATEQAASGGLLSRLLQVGSGTRTLLTLVAVAALAIGVGYTISATARLTKEA